MVEAQPDQPPFSPPPEGYFADTHTRTRSEESPYDLSGGDPEDQDLYDITTPTLKDSTPGSSGGMSESGRHDNAKSESRQRRTRSTTNNPPQRQQQQHQSSAYFQSSSDNAHNRPPSNFQQGSSTHYPSAPLTYAQGPSYVAQYTVSSQPSPVAMTSSPFTYYHPQMVGDGNMVSQNIHGSYPTMLQPVFSYQGEHVSSPHPSFPGTRSSFSPRPGNTSSSSSSTHLSSAGQASSPVYVAPGAFQSLQYPSPMPAPPYGYATQTFSPSPMYQSPQFAPSPFAQHFPQSQDAEPQGTWFYLPHPSATSHSPHQAGPSYQGHYTVTYQQSGGVEGPYHHSDPSLADAHPSPYPATPSRSQFSDEHFPESPLAPHTGYSIATSVPRPASASSGSGRRAASDRPMMRRSWHPNPPAHRSEWVMWAGNVPSDATHDELWRFFHQDPSSLPPRPSGQSSKSRSPCPPAIDGDAGSSREGDVGPGVISIFLIARSNCAFINYVSEPLLHRAIVTFDGHPLRPKDPRCPRLVCRVRARDDDLRAGVGAQRGMGMHTKWIKDQKSFRPPGPPAAPGRSRALNASSSSGTDVSASGDEDELRGRDGRHARHESSSGSYASTNSSFLAKHYPRRYFILKSLTQEDLDISVEAGVWATQKHNEEILDQAFRTSQEVFLVFSVNKSREFYGYARMAGPVLRGEKRTTWASRSSRSATSPTDARNPGKTIFTPQTGRQVDSPLAVAHESVADNPNPNTAAHEASLRGPLVDQLARTSRASAPALLGEKYRLPTVATPAAQHSLDLRRLNRQQFPLDPEAPLRAMRVHQQPDEGTSDMSAIHEGHVDVPRPDNMSRARTSSALQPVTEEHPLGIDGNLKDLPKAMAHLSFQQERQIDGHPGPQVDGMADADAKEGQDDGSEMWGDSFAVEWLCTDRVSFNRTRHLRNPWNHDKEVKVSRDGTELEPTVGQQLLDEWPRLAGDPGPLPTPLNTPGAGRGAGSRGTQGSRQNPPPEAPGAGDGVASGRDGGGGGGKSARARVDGAQPRS